MGCIHKHAISSGLLGRYFTNFKMKNKFFDVELKNKRNFLRNEYDELVDFR